MREWRMGVLILCAVAGVFLAGCGKAPASRYYVLEAATGPQLPAAGPAVQVVRFTVAPPYNQDRIIYRVGAGDVQVRFYPYDRWAVPLDEMVANLVATSFDGVGGVHFTRGGRAVDGGLRLDGHLLRLEEVDMPAGPRIRYRLDLTLTAASGEVLHQVRLENEGEAPTDQVEGVVRWMQTVLVADLAQVRPGLAGALAEALPSR
jgi:ABC-type uncharacterized transport system auxiliary subunit